MGRYEIVPGLSKGEMGNRNIGVRVAEMYLTQVHFQMQQQWKDTILRLEAKNH